MYFAYILQSQKSGRLYYGSSDDPNRRLMEHNCGHTKSTRNKGPWNLIFSKEFASRQEALAFERSLKRLKNRNYILTEIVGIKKG